MVAGPRVERGPAGLWDPRRLPTPALRGADIPLVSELVAAADRSPLPFGSRACLMLFTVEFAPIPRVDRRVFFTACDGQPGARALRPLSRLAVPVRSRLDESASPASASEHAKGPPLRWSASLERPGYPVRIAPTPWTAPGRAAATCGHHSSSRTQHRVAARRQHQSRDRPSSLSRVQCCDTYSSVRPFGVRTRSRPCDINGRAAVRLPPSELNSHQLEMAQSSGSGARGE